jgi:hypothetical protein
VIAISAVREKYEYKSDGSKCKPKEEREKEGNDNKCKPGEQEEKANGSKFRV